MTNKPKTTNLNPLKNRMLKAVVVGWVCLMNCISCEYPALYDRYQPVEQTGWGKEKVYYFTFEVQDTAVPYDLTLNIRNNNLYPYQNLWLFCSEEHPIGPLRQDTIECMLADEYGKWYGNGLSLFHTGFPIRTHYKFPHAGQYTFSFRQGMRRDTLIGIQEIGLTVRASKDN